MSTLWIAALLLAAGGGDGTAATVVPSPSAVVEQEPLVPLRTGRKLRDAARAALARWAKPSDKEADLAAGEFIVLYRELQADDKLARSQSEPLMMKIRGRLVALQRQINKRIAIEKRLAKQAERPPSVDAAAGREDVLAQWGGVGRGFGRGGGRFAGRGFGGGLMRGAGVGGPVGGNPVGVQDYGEQLVELIQQTIAPSTWDVNGGLGTIYYWQPGRAIVVRNRAEVHHRIGGLLEQMNRLGR